MNENEGHRNLKETYVSGVHSRDGDEGPGCAAPAAGDLDLRTADVELRTAVGRGDVQGYCFHADEVSRGRVGG